MFQFHFFDFLFYLIGSVCVPHEQMSVRLSVLYVGSMGYVSDVKRMTPRPAPSTPYSTEHSHWKGEQRCTNMYLQPITDIARGKWSQIRRSDTVLEG